MHKTLATVTITCLFLSVAALSAEAPSTGVTIWYKHDGSWIPASPATSGLPPVAVYLFQDSRPSAPDYVPYILPAIGISPAYKGPPPIRASEPVVFSVTRAFAEGLEARGFPVVDRTRRAFQMGDPADGARRGLRGELLRFAMWPGWVTVNPFEGKYALTQGGIVCAISVEIFDLESGKKLWEKTYSGKSPPIDEATSYRLQNMQPGIGWAREMEPSLAAALAGAVENAVMDPELVDALRLSGS
jgi:hypothetical protein